jgi:hypothetical protein
MKKKIDGGNYTIKKLPLRPDLDRHTVEVIYELLGDILEKEFFSALTHRQLNKYTWADEAKKRGPTGSAVLAGIVGVPAANVLIELKQKLAPSELEEKTRVTEPKNCMECQLAFCANPCPYKVSNESKKEKETK